jgi:hypothetical protein
MLLKHDSKIFQSHISKVSSKQYRLLTITFLRNKHENEPRTHREL